VGDCGKISLQKQEEYRKMGSPKKWVTKLGQDSSIIMVDKIPNGSNMI